MTREIRPKIDEANEIAKQLGQNVTFSFGIIGGKGNGGGIGLSLSSFTSGEKKYDIEVKVNNLDSEEQYIWDRSKFNDRLTEMRDLLATYEQDGEIDTHDANPFTDKAEPALIGEGYFRMECLAHLIDNPITVNLIGSNYENHG